MKKIFTLIAICFCLFANSQVSQQTVRTSELGCIVWYPPNYNPATKYPLIIFAHGVGQAIHIPPTQNLNNMYDDGMPKVLKNGFVPNYNFIMVAPQDSLYSVNPNVVGYIIHEAKLRWNIDTARIHLVSFSGGGGMTHGVMTSWDTTTAKQIASIVSVAGICVPPHFDSSQTAINRIAISKIPLLEIIGTADSTIGYQSEVNLMNRFNTVLPGVATLISEQGVGHTDFGIFDTTFGLINVYTWLQQHPLGSYTPGQPPVIIAANAGANQSITLPVDSITLNGSGSSNKGPIVSYTWSKLSGMTGDSILSPNTAVTLVKKMDTAGIYVYQLKVIDSAGNMATSSTTITVNPPAGSAIIVQAESRSSCNDCTGVQTAGTGQIIGVIAPGQINFSSINIPSTKTYTVTCHYATPNSGGTVQFKNASGTILATASIVSTGNWSVYRDLTFSVSLSAGVQNISLAVVTAGFNLDYLTLQ